MAKLRLSVELWDVSSANELQATDEALDRRTDRTREGIEQVVAGLLQKGQYKVSWARLPEVEEPIFDETVEWSAQPTLFSTPSSD